MTMVENILGMAALFVSMAVQVVIPPIPAEAIVIAAGKMYGVLRTTLVAGTGLYAGTIAVYYFGRFLQRKFNRFFCRERIDIAVRNIRRYDAWILWIRILPYNPSDIISYAAGIAHVSKGKFFATSLITSYVRCFLLGLFGARITGLQSIFQTAGVLAISSILAYLLLFYRKKDSKKKGKSQKKKDDELRPCFIF